MYLFKKKIHLTLCFSKKVSPNDLIAERRSLETSCTLDALIKGQS